MIGKVLTEIVDRYDKILSRQGEALAMGIYAQFKEVMFMENSRGGWILPRQNKAVLAPGHTVPAREFFPGTKGSSPAGGLRITQQKVNKFPYGIPIPKPEANGRICKRSPQINLRGSIN